MRLDEINTPEVVYLEGGVLAGRRKVIEAGSQTITFPDAPGVIYKRAKPERFMYGEIVYESIGRQA